MWNANASAWIEMSRAGHDVYRDLVNTPAFMDMLPPVDGLLGIDIGCGEGTNTAKVVERGATVVGVDISEVFLDATASGTRSVQADAVALPFRSASVDFATAFMSVMDTPDPELVLREIARVLEPGGFVQFSVGHPVSAIAHREWVEDDDGRREALTIGRYFEEGFVTERWTFGTAPPELRDRHRPFTITYARRTLTGWFRAITEAGLWIEEVGEPHASEELARRRPEVADTRIVPYFLVLRARKPDHPLVGSALPSDRSDRHDPGEAADVDDE